MKYATYGIYGENSGSGNVYSPCIAIHAWNAGIPLLHGRDIAETDVADAHL